MEIDVSAIVEALGPWAPILIQALVGWQTLRLVAGRVRRLETRCEQQHGPLPPLPEPAVKVGSSIGVLLVLVSLAGCATVEKAGRDFADCTLSSATAETMKLVGDLDSVTKIGAMDWEARGKDIGLRVGFDAFKCALQVLAGVVANRLEVALAPGEMGLSPNLTVGALREQLGRVRQLQGGVP